jgi:hypothetical protein
MAFKSHIPKQALREPHQAPEAPKLIHFIREAGRLPISRSGSSSYAPILHRRSFEICPPCGLLSYPRKCLRIKGKRSA